MLNRAIALLILPMLPLAALAADFPLSDKNTTITFVGTKPNGSHTGGFKGITGKAVVANNDPTSLKITLDIDMNYLHSDNPNLTSHLKSPDFFGVKANPKAQFVTTKIEKDGDRYKITGDLTMIRKTVSVSFPATISATGDSLTVTSDFTIDRTKWGMTYGKGKIDDEVKLKVSVKAQN